MLKLTKLALATGVSLMALALPADAGPIAPLIAGAVTFIKGATLAASLTKIALGVAANIGLSLLQRALTKKPKPQGGVESSADLGVEVYRKISFGRTLVAGRPIFVKGVGNSNKRYHYVWHIGDWTYEALESIIYNGKPCTLTAIATVGPETARYTVDGFNGKFVLKFFRGTFPQTADPEVVAASADTAGQTIGAWTSAHRGDGVCLVTGYIDYDEKAFADGIDSQPQFVVKGARLYDWRKDSTAGGVGAHRWNDPATWEYSENPAVCDYNYERGFWRNGQLLLGKGVGAADLLLSHYTTAANICDEALTEGGNPTKRYACSHIATSEAEHRVAKESFRLAMAADFIEANGLTGPIAGAAYASVLAQPITDDDLIRGEGFSYTRDPEEPYNAVSCKWINPALGWQSDDLALRTNPAWEVEDGGDRLITSLDLQSVPYLYQAARIQSLVHEQSRMTAQCTGTYHRKYAALEPGDWVTRTFNRKGHPTMTAKVVGVSRQPNGNVRLTLRQCAAANFTPPVGTPVSTPAPVVIPHQRELLLTGFGASAGFVESAGQSRPTLNVVWTAPADPAIVAVQVEYRLLNNALSLRAERVAPPGAGVVLAADILAASTYQIRIRPEFENGDAGTWTDYAEVLTSTAFSVMSSRIAHDTQQIFGQNWSNYTNDALVNALEIGERYMADAVLQERSSRDVLSVANASNTVNASVIQERIARISENEALAVIANTAQATANGANAAVATEQAARISADNSLASNISTAQTTANNALAAVSTEESARISADGVLAANITTAQTTANNAAAAVTTEQSARISADNTLASNITTAQTTANNAAAAVTTEESARIAADGALSTSITGVQASVNDVSAGALFKLVAGSGGAGVFSRITAQVRVATSGTSDETTFRSAGWLLDVFDSGAGVYKGRMVVEADQFAIKTSGSPFIPFAVIGADTYIQKVLVGQSIESENFEEGVIGFKLDSTGTLYAENAFIGGGSSLKRSFEMVFGYVQDGILSSEPAAALDYAFVIDPNTPSWNNINVTVSGIVRRLPSACEYDLVVTFGSAETRIKKSVSRSKGVAWGGLTELIGTALHSGTGMRSVAYIHFTDDGVCSVRTWGYTATTWNNAIYSQTSVQVARILNEPDKDPMMEGLYDASVWHIWKDTPMSGIRVVRVPPTVLVSSTPTAVVGVKIKMWAAGAGVGGPGGYVENIIALTPGEILTLLVGSAKGAGFGGEGSAYEAGANAFGGGASIVCRGAFRRENFLLVAGGGGVDRTGTGSPGGHPSWAGSNGVTETDVRRCKGIGGFPSGSASYVVVGGGGYEGGGALPSNVAGRGGTNYIKTPLISSQDLYQSANANGTATARTPPNTGDSVYTTYSASTEVGGLATGVGASTDKPGGGGMIAVQWLTSI